MRGVARLSSVPTIELPVALTIPKGPMLEVLRVLLRPTNDMMLSVEIEATDRYCDTLTDRSCTNDYRCRAKIDTGFKIVSVPSFVVANPDGHRKRAKADLRAGSISFREVLRVSSLGVITCGCRISSSTLTSPNQSQEGRLWRAELQLTDAASPCSDIETSRPRTIKHQVGDHRIVLSNIRGRAYHPVLRSPSSKPSANTAIALHVRLTILTRSCSDHVRLVLSITLSIYSTLYLAIHELPPWRPFSHDGPYSQPLRRQPWSVQQFTCPGLNPCDLTRHTKSPPKHFHSHVLCSFPVSSKSSTSNKSTMTRSASPSSFLEARARSVACQLHVCERKPDFCLKMRINSMADKAAQPPFSPSTLRQVLGSQHFVPTRPSRHQPRKAPLTCW
jgi:hypothetical protein